MPIAAFPGTRGWGYDGAYLYAPYARYGRPEDLKRQSLPYPPPRHPPRRRLQPLRPRRELSAGDRAGFLYRSAPYAVGRGARFFRAEQPAGARFYHSQRTLLAAGICLRWAPPRCRPCHPRRQQARHLDRVGSDRAPRDHRPGDPSRSGKRSQRGALPGAHGRLGRLLHRAVERRFAPCPARPDNRRGCGLLLGLRSAAGGSSQPRFGRRLCLSGRSVAVSSRQAPR